MQSGKEADARVYRLRRDIHRIEKGLLMKERRTSFAADYITETVDAFEACMGRVSERTPELEWAHAVLSSFFETVVGDPRVEAAARRFDAVSLPWKRGAPVCERDIARHSGLKPCEVTFAQLLALAQRRKAVRRFLPRPVDPALIDRAISLARLAPSACNRQGYHFRVLTEPERIERVVSLSWGMSGFSPGIPILIAVSGRLRAFAEPHDRHLIYIDGALATAYLMLALETLSLASCPVNWPDVHEKNAGLGKILGFSRDERAVMLLAVGYPDPDCALARSERRSVADLRSYGDEDSAGP
jgi:nitroreductase